MIGTDRGGTAIGGHPPPEDTVPRRQQCPSDKVMDSQGIRHGEVRVSLL